MPAGSEPTTGSIRVEDLRRGDVVRVKDGLGYVILLDDPEPKRESVNGVESPTVLVVRAREVSKTKHVGKREQVIQWQRGKRARICGWDFAEAVQMRLERELEFDRTMREARERVTA